MGDGNYDSGFQAGYARGKYDGFFEAAVARHHIEDKIWSMDPNRGICKCSPCQSFNAAVREEKDVRLGRKKK